MKTSTAIILWIIVGILLVIAAIYIILALSGKDVILWIPVTLSLSAATLSTYINIKSGTYEESFNKKSRKQHSK